MNSRERFATVFRHEEPDRIPLDIGGTPDSGININLCRAYNKMKGIIWEPELSNLITQTAQVDKTLREAAGIDTIPLMSGSPTGFKPEIRNPGDGYLHYKDKLGIEYRMPESGSRYFDICRSPLADAGTIEDIEQHPWPEPADEGLLRSLREQAEKLSRETEYAVILNSAYSGLMETSCWLRGMADFLADLASGSIMAEYLLDKVLEQKLAYIDAALPAVRDRIQAIDEADDLGMQTSLLISPELYRRKIKPRHRIIMDRIRKLAPNVKIFFHTCGAVRPLIGDLIECGIDALNPVQFSCPGMDVKELKKEFGRDLVFWGGGANTQTTLPRGTPQQVRDEVKQQIEVLAPGGGFVFAAVHNLQSDIPAENLEAFLEAFHENNRYV